MDQLQRPTAVLAVDNETSSSITRTTADGRSITYSLTVLQQPVRARACGQGAKSSADRRPVDPPPIVELTIHQGEKREEDVTFTMNANYFLFATLEQARPIAQGRVLPEKSSHPVLTGTPVAGMVYLDRPKPAGYFIFPDLSVRHEGKYRLSFSLYEELKNAKDDEKMEDGASPAVPGDHHVTHRLDVRSEPFHVYSAKKFPGLTESTSLSRMVADQGCRVRIRRDVRMRRREPKAGSKEWDEYEDETAAARARQQSVTPDPSIYSMVQTPQGYMEPVSRPRSASNASHHSIGTNVTRRPSLQDIATTYTQPQYPTALHTPRQGYPQPPSSYGPQPGQQQFTPAQFVQQQPSMQPPPPQYQPQALPAPPPFPAAPTGYYGPSPPSAPQQPQSQYSGPSQSYDAAPPPPPRALTDYSAQPQTTYRRPSQHIPPPPPPQSGFTHQLSQQSYQPPPPPPQLPQRASHRSMDLYSSSVAPLEPLQPPTRAMGATTPLPAKSSFDLPPINTAMLSANKLEASSPLSAAAPQSSYFSNASTPQDTHKRSFGNVFSDRHQNGPLRQGARPMTFGHVDNMPVGTALSAADDEDSINGELDPDALGMHYRRADGRTILRALPGHI